MIYSYMSCGCDKDNNFSFREAARSITRAAKTVVKSVTDANYDPLVPKEEMERRMKICESCEQHTVTLNKLRCRICGCFLRAKTSLKDQSCPHPDGPKW